MEENTNSTFFTFDSPKGQSSYIKVIGVGGGGCNAVNHMFDKGIEGVDFIVCNTDMKSLNASPVPNKIPLGNGLGTGKRPELARKAAQDKADDIREALAHNTKMLFITAGMGGGTGTGAAPVIAEIAKSIEVEDEVDNKILVVAVVTRPFGFEGAACRAQAETGIDELRKHVDSIVVINNDKLRAFGNLAFTKAFNMADDVLLTAVKGIAEIVTVDAYVNRDFKDVNTVMGNSGTALMGIGSGSGENRAKDAIEGATTSVLLDDSDIRGAKKVLLYFTYNAENEMTIDELTEITDYVGQLTGGSAEILWGAGPDASLADELKVILIATGFEKSKTEPREPIVHILPEDTPKDEPRKVETEDKQPKDEMELIHKEKVEEEVKTDIQAFEAPKVPVEKHIINLYDEEPVAEKVRTEILSKAEAYKPVVDTMVEDIHVMTLEKPVEVPQPVVQENVFAEVETPQVPVHEPVSAFKNDNDCKTAADRIALIHDLLRSNPNGAEIVQAMVTGEFSDETLYEGRSSAVRESSSTTLRPDGRMVQNPYFRDQAD